MVTSLLPLNITIWWSVDANDCAIFITGIFGLSKFIFFGSKNLSQSSFPLGLVDIFLLSSIRARVPSKSKITIFFIIFICLTTYYKSHHRWFLIVLLALRIIVLLLNYRKHQDNHTNPFQVRFG